MKKTIQILAFITFIVIAALSAFVPDDKGTMLVLRGFLFIGALFITCMIGNGLV